MMGRLSRGARARAFGRRPTPEQFGSFVERARTRTALCTSPPPLHLPRALTSVKSAAASRAHKGSYRSKPPPCVVRRRRCVKEAVPYALHTLPPPGAVRLDAGDLFAAAVAQQAGALAIAGERAQFAPARDNHPRPAASLGYIADKRKRRSADRDGWSAPPDPCVTLATRRSEKG